jgi:hypothetical protein
MTETAELPKTIEQAHAATKHHGRPFMTDAQKKFRDQIWTNTVMAKTKEAATMEIAHKRQKLEAEIENIRTHMSTQVLGPETGKAVIHGIEQILTVLASAQRSVEARSRRIAHMAQKVHPVKIPAGTSGRTGTKHLSGPQTIVSIYGKGMGQVQKMLPREEAVNQALLLLGRRIDQLQAQVGAQK